MTDSDLHIKSLQERGVRITAQRRAVLEVLARHGVHLTAEQILAQARAIDPNISLTTVYRTLTLLKERQLINQRYISPEHTCAHFDLVDRVPPVFFQCRECGRVLEVPGEPLMKALRTSRSARTLVAEVTHLCVCAEGLCADCAKKERSA